METEAHHIATKASDVAEDVVSHLPTAAVHKDFTKNVDHEADKNDDSPWGKAFEIGSAHGMTVYCVDCAMKGKLSMSGSISVHPAKGKDMFQAGSLDIHLEDFSVPMIFGFEAKHFNTPRIPIPFKKGVFALPLTPFSIPNVFVDGPQVDYKIELQLALSATGNLKTGITMTWDDAKAHLDLKSESDKVGGSGWGPRIDKTFDMSDGQLVINASLASPLSIGCGINILNSLVNIQAEVVDTPSIELDTKLNFEGNKKRDYSYNDRSHARELVPRELRIREDDAQCKNGIQNRISFVDRLSAEVAGLYRHPVTSYSKLIWKTCHHTPASDKLGHDATNMPKITGPGPTAPSMGASIPHPSSAFPKFQGNGTAGVGPTGGSAGTGGTAPAPTTSPPSTPSAT